MQNIPEGYGVFRMYDLQIELFSCSKQKTKLYETK